MINKYKKKYIIKNIYTVMSDLEQELLEKKEKKSQKGGKKNIIIVDEKDMNHIHEYGQYFTKNETLKEKVYEFILNKPKKILEPSMGRGDLIDCINKKDQKILFDMFEIDKTIKFLDTIDKKKIKFGDFLEQEIKEKYTTIIGNPPYVKTQKGNLYIDFIKKCFNLLDEKGELIFVIPSDFFKLTSSTKLLNEMMTDGNFTHIYHPHDEKLFENASIDVIVFRYCKNKKLDNTILYNDKKMFVNNSNGLITFSDKVNKITETFQDYFDIYVGIVSGKDEIYKNEDIGNIDVLTKKDTIEKFILINKFPSGDKQIDDYLLLKKDVLMTRKIKKFNDKNWFEWGAPRNIKTIEEKINKDCIYIYNLSRQKNVAFKGKINYFGGNLIMLSPKKKLNLDKIVNFLNTDVFKNNFMFAGRFKIGHRQISNSYFDISNF
jgi:adenine-specific DNA-methyltransferase